MKAYLLLAFVALFSVACATTVNIEKDKKTIVGTWSVDLAMTKQYVKKDLEAKIKEIKEKSPKDSQEKEIKTVQQEYDRFIEDTKTPSVQRCLKKCKLHSMMTLLVYL